MSQENKFNKEFLPVTIFYCGTIIILSIISKTYENSPFIKNIKLDYKKVIKKHEFWRLITTFFYIGKFSPKFFFKFFLYFRRIKSNETKFIKRKKLAEFIMMLIYLMIIIHIFNFIGYYYFKIKINSFLSHQLMFSIILINSKREPNKLFRFYFFQIENRYVPFFLFSYRVAKNGDKILNHMISFIPGLAYYWLKDEGPRSGIINNILITPKFLVDFIEENYYKKKKKNKRKSDKKNDINSMKNNNDNSDLNSNNINNS